MDIRRESSIPGVKDFQIQGPWIPVTPVKPILTRPQPIYADRQGNQLGQANWLESERLSSGLSQETQAHRIVACYDSRNTVELNRGFNNWDASGAKIQVSGDNVGTYQDLNRDFNDWEAASAAKIQVSGENVGSYHDLNRGFNNWEEASAAQIRASSHNDGTYGKSSLDTLEGWDNIPFGDLLALADAASAASASALPQGNDSGANSPYISVLNSQIAGNQIESSSASLLLKNQDLSLGSNQWINSNCAPEIPQYGFHTPYRPAYDLNSLPTTIADAVSSRTISSSQFVPITPDQAKRVENKQASEIPNFCVEERINQEREENVVATTRVEVNELHCDKEHPQPVTDSSSAAVFTPSKENHNPDKGGGDGIDLNKTPQKARRRKHRPKVIIEGKPKRTPKLVTPSPNGSKENPTGKRKYVRKNGLNKPLTTPLAEVTSGTTDPKTIGPTVNSCRRALNFDLEGQARDESSSCKPPFISNSESRAQNFCNRGVQSKSTVQLGQGLEVIVENTEASIAYDLTRSMNQMLKDYISLPEKQAPSTPPQTKTGPPREKLKTGAQNEYAEGNSQEALSAETASDKQGNTVDLMFKKDTQTAPKSPNESNCSSSTCLTEGEQARGLKREHWRTIEQAELSSMNVIGARYNSLQAYHAMFQANEYNSNRIPGMHFPEIYKKKRTEKGQNSSTSSTLSSVSAAENSVRQATAYPLNDASANLFASNNICGISAPQYNSSRTPTKIAAVGGAQDKLQTFECMLALGHIERLKRKRSKGPTRVRDLASLIGIPECKQLPTFPARRIQSSGATQGFEISHKPHTCMEALVAVTHATMAKKKRTKKRNSLVNSAVSVYNHHGFLTKSIGPSGVIWRNMLSIDAIVEQLRRLDINRESNNIADTEQNALVPYYMGNQGQNALVIYRRDGTVVPFEGSFDPVRKRRPRPKVDLDEETNRVWKLLLGNINSEGIDGTDEEKAKWWEEERRVFRGRADSFIARMHLVQGDRRFSRWKGSVLDSVIGVFLTQNVSDHLSSSAFMSLAAHFPLKPKSNNRSCHEEGTSILVEEPEVCILDPEDTIKWHEKMSNQPVCDRSSITLHDMEHNEEKEVVNSNDSFGSNTDGVSSLDNSRGKLLDSSESGPEMYHESPVNGSTTHLTGTGIASFIGDRREMEDVVSSQNSVNSSIVQTAERIGSCSESNSEAEDTTTRSKANSYDGSTFVELLHITGTTMLHEVCRHGSGNEPYKGEHNRSEGMEYDKQKQDIDRLDGPETSVGVSIIPSSNYRLHLTPNTRVLEVESFDMCKEESRSSNISKEKDENCMSQQSGLTAESASQAPVQKMLTVSTQEAPRSSSENNHSCKNLQGEANNFQSESTPVGDPKNMVESLTQLQNNKMQQVLNVPNFSGENLDVTESTSVFQKNTEHKTVESNLNHQDYSSGKTYNEMTANTLKAKRGRVGKEKNNAFDWDSLRTQAQANGHKRERTANTMDSLDWEAVRCADVNEIANTIKERGMNNMLAERIKDFLNRLVRDHGSTDLEWLRDVPPDKAKEYLLSVRGLGLKSVECVRLLTLHHLAFPVDTNVGRIAVRLGWVPLQPLPESLQLHLLELYPVLESIQKYLWPRLCKLDQRTLYELHYQMITFGKVFCTKSKPNCNACPMRGECRHFASAFASARLALPGPEEKSIVSATENIAADQNPAVIINPLQLPQANQQSEAKSGISNCEPIIEEPATPEPEHKQISESDIEDSFYEDPDEIPTIKLNIEEFTQNLQNYMQENMELQEGDMSKALVALTPDAASIPMPKLKNVSRLRTEHQVYELPDSHPLLEGLDKREPDDPCSYLLAIWTPGETANSIQPPDIRCSSQEFGKLCDEKTCFSCNSVREVNSQTVRGTLLIPCRTAMRGSFPLNGTYFQVNEVFADHDSSLNPIDVPRTWIWNLPRRTVYFGTSIPTIFKGLSTEGIQYCFWRGFVCVRGFDQKTRAPRPLMARLHFPASKLVRAKGKTE